MLKALSSSAQKILLKYQKAGQLEFFREIAQNKEFQSVLSTVDLFTKELVEDKIHHKLDSFFGYKINAFLPMCKEEDLFNIGLFFIPKGKKLPLHDHPEMLVVSKVLSGSLNFVGIDFFDHRIQVELPKKLYGYKPVDDFDMKEIIKGKLNCRKTLKKNDLLYLTPFHCNIHQFEAVENSVILDILIPRYDLERRFCNFYELVDESEDKVNLRYLFPPPDYDCLCINL